MPMVLLLLQSFTQRWVRCAFTIIKLSTLLIPFAILTIAPESYVHSEKRHAVLAVLQIHKCGLKVQCKPGLRTCVRASSF